MSLSSPRASALTVHLLQKEGFWGQTVIWYWVCDLSNLGPAPSSDPEFSVTEQQHQSPFYAVLLLSEALEKLLREQILMCEKKQLQDPAGNRGDEAENAQLHGAHFVPL